VNAAVEVRGDGRHGRCRRLIATLHLFDIDEQHHRLRDTHQFSWSVPSDLTGTVTLGCPHCSGNAGQRAVDLSALLSHPLEEHERTGTTAIARLHP
jgi:hypothetical protein